MKTSSYIQKSVIRSVVKSALLALALVSMGQAKAQVIIPINNDDFDGGGGAMPGVLTLLGGATNSGPQQIGTSGWYGQANATNLTVLGSNVAGFRAGIEVDFDASSTNVGEISYALGASLGGLAGLEMPESTIWQPLAGFSLAANQTYTFSIDVNAGSLLDVAALTARGFGIGVTTSSSASSVGNYYVNSISNPGLVSLNLLGGNDQRLSLTFTTGASVPAGDLGLAIFAGRGTQSLQASLLTDFDIDNAQFSAVPEPSTVVLIGLGMMILLQGHRMTKNLRKTQADA